MTGVALKYLCERPAEYGMNISPDRYQSSGVRLLRTTDVNGDGSLASDSGVYLDADDVPASMLLQAGDILFSRSGTLGRALVYDPDRHGPATFAGFLVRFRLRPGVDPRAVRYWSESSPFVGAVEAGAIHSTISNFNAERYAALKVHGHLVKNSRLTADFLDAATARIDALVATRRRSARLARERFESRLWATATKGLVPAPLRASGVAWVGDIPVHWGTPAVGHVFEVQLGKMLNPDATAAGEMFPYLRNENVQWDRIDLGDLNEMHFNVSERSRYRLEPGDLLVCEGGEVGRAAMWQGDLSPCYYQKALHRVRPRGSINTRFLMYVLRAAAGRGVFANEGNSSTIVHLTAEKLRAHRFPCPPIHEQDRIVQELDREAVTLVVVETMLSRQIALLHERRQALITAAVTGQLEIPGLAA